MRHENLEVSRLFENFGRDVNVVRIDMDDKEKFNFAYSFAATHSQSHDRIQNTLPVCAFVLTFSFTVLLTPYNGLARDDSQFRNFVNSKI